MSESKSSEEVAVLDHDFFSSSFFTSINPLQSLWEAVRLKHPGNQMIAIKIKTYTILKDFFINKLEMQEADLLGSDLVPQQYASVKMPQISGAKPGSTDKIFTCEDVSIDLINGVHRLVFGGKTILIYVFHLQSGETDREICILTWEDDSLVLGKQLIAEAYTWHHRSVSSPDVKKCDKFSCKSEVKKDCKNNRYTLEFHTAPKEKLGTFCYVQGSSGNSTMVAKDLFVGSEIAGKLIGDVQAFFDNEKLYQDLEISWKRGLLLTGPKGSGKMDVIEFILQKFVRDYTNLKVQFTKTMLAMDGAQAIMKNIFRGARSHAPCILVLENLELIGTGKIRSHFLQELENVKTTKGLLVIAVANMTLKVDEDFYLKKPYRFDTHYALNPPDREEFSQLIVVWLEDKVGKDRLIYDSEDVTSYDELVKVLNELTQGWKWSSFKTASSTFLQYMAAAGIKSEEKQPIASVSQLVSQFKEISENIKRNVEAEAKKKTDAKNDPPQKPLKGDVLKKGESSSDSVEDKDDKKPVVKETKNGEA